MVQLRGDERLPRYQRVADQLRQEIVTGQRRPGDRMPSENVLADQYGLAPGTVRQAISELVSEGVLERFQGKGTFVRRPSFDQSLFRFFRFRGAGGEKMLPQSRILRRVVETLPAHAAERLNVDPSEPGICISRLRLIDEKPVLAEEIWLQLSRFKPLMDIEDAAFGPLLYPIYEEVCGLVVARAEEDLSAEPANTATAALLRMTEGEPAIVIERLAYGFDGGPLEWRRSHGRADQFHYRTEIR